jgi:hypothetical protein
MPGAKSRAELVAVADASTFLDPPAAKVPDIAAPDLAMQRQMMSKTLDYLAKTIPRLPNFSCCAGYGSLSGDREKRRRDMEGCDRRSEAA